MPDINSSQLCLTPFEESSKDKKELEASATSNESIFWPPPYMQHVPSAEQAGMDMYPFSANYREAGNEVPPAQVNPQGGNDYKHNKGKLTHWLLLALGILIVGCAGYQLGKSCGFWKGYRHGSDEYNRRERGCRDEDGYWRRESDRHYEDWDGRRHDRYDGDIFDWALEGNDERYRFGGREGGQSCEFRKREEEQRVHMDVCTHGTDDRRMMEWDNREGGYSYYQIVRDPDTESHPPRILEALAINVDGRPVFNIFDEGLRSQVGDFGGNFPEFMSRCNQTMAEQSGVVDFDSNQVFPANFRWVEMDEDQDFFQQARAMLEDMVTEDTEFRRLVPDNGPRETSNCSQSFPIVLPHGFSFESTADALRVNMGYYDICIN